MMPVAFRTTPSCRLVRRQLDRTSTRLNSSHSQISYAVFCLQKKNPSSSNVHTVRRRYPPSDYSNEDQRLLTALYVRTRDESLCSPSRLTHPQRCHVDTPVAD